MAKLDLHGVKHIDVVRVVEDFLFSNTPPIHIITGNSEKMKKIVFNILDDHDYKYLVWTYNLGEIVITE